MHRLRDPIEQSLPGVTQVQVNTRCGVTFASALRALLRQDPDHLVEVAGDDQRSPAFAKTCNGSRPQRAVGPDDVAQRRCLPRIVDRLD